MIDWKVNRVDFNSFIYIHIYIYYACMYFITITNVDFLIILYFSLSVYSSLGEAKYHNRAFFLKNGLYSGPPLIKSSLNHNFG